MGFFDHYFEGEVSDFGLLIEKKQNLNIFSHIFSFITNKDAKLLEIGAGKGHFSKICINNGIN